MRAQALISASLCIICCSLSAQQNDTLSKYTPEEIGQIRLDYARQGRYEEWIAKFKAWENAKGSPLTHADSAVWYALKAAFAYTYFDLRQLDSADAILQPVLDISVAQFPEEYLKVKNAWGVRLIYGGRFVDARKHYHDFRILLDNKTLTATPAQYCNIVHNLGVSNLQLGDYDGALEVFRHIEDVIRENEIDDNRLKANLQLNLAGTYSHLRNDAQSLVHSRAAFALNLEEHGLNHPFTAQTLNGVANGLQQTGDLEGAMTTYRQVLDIYERIGRTEHPLRTVALLNLAETLDKLGKPEEAMNYVIPCINIRLKTYGIRHSEVARAFKTKGRVLGHLGRYDEAIASLDTSLMALGYDENSEDPYSGVDAMFNLFYTLDHKADIYYERSLQHPSEENLLAARHAYEHGITVLNDLRTHFKGKLSKGTLNEKSYMFYEPAIDVCLKLYELTGDEGSLAQALQWSSESKGNDFYDLVRGAKAMMTAQVPDSVRQRDEQFQRDLAELESAWYDAKSTDKDNLTDARKSLDQRKQEYREWLSSLETSFPRYYEVLHEHSTLDIQARQKSLSVANAQLIEYFIADSNAFVFVLTPYGVHYVRLAHPSQINAAVDEWRTGFRNDEHAHLTLSKLIWQPLTKYLGDATHLIIVADGALTSVPFELMEDIDGGMALERFVVSYDYSSRGNPSRSKHDKNRKWLGMAPVYDLQGEHIALASRGLDSAMLRLRDIEWMRLPGAEAEVQAIGALTGGEMRVGKEATEHFFRSQARDYGILHLSMHVWTDDDEPLLSTLVFSNTNTDSLSDGKLYAHEIFQLDLPAQLAVLSACNTGVGTFRRGEGISSLARAFLFAGTKATVMSLWKVPDESTSKIMQAFYRHLRGGESKDEALRHAKLDYLNAPMEPELKTPYHWAGFVLMGDTAPVYESGFPIGLAGIIAGVGLLVGLMIWMRRQKKMDAANTGSV